MRKTTILGILVLLAVLVIPAASASEYYLDPDNSSADNGASTEVAIWIDATENIRSGKITLEFDPLCGNITGYTRNATVFQDGTNIVRYDWSPPALVITYGHLTAEQSADKYHLANFTIEGNSTTYCISDLLFVSETYARNNTHQIPTVTDNGTFACGVPPGADLIVNRIDPKYIFADLNNSLFANVTNQGVAASGPFDVCIEITDDIGTVLYNPAPVRFDSLDPGESTCYSCAVCKSKGFLGWWTPGTPLENITINVTADCTGMVDEGAGEGNNTRIEYRNTTGDCDIDTMLPDTCYEYQGQHPMNTVYEGGCGVIYSVGDYKYKTNTTVNFDIGASGDENQVDGSVADIPDGATIKNATLYVYYCWRQIENSPNPGDDPRLDYEMSFDGYNLTCNEYYTDGKGFGGGTKYQYGTLVYDVTANVTDVDATYQAVRSNSSTASGETKGYVSGMALMVIYEDASGCEYRIAHGYDRLATLYYYAGSYRPQRMEYYVDSADATTTATLTDVDPNTMAGANLFTVTLDATPPGSESEQFNSRPWEVGAWDCVAGVPTCNYNYPIGINRGAVDKSDITPSGTDEVVKFQERTSNGFAPVFACLQTSGGPTKIWIDQPTYVQPQDQFYVNITVTPDGNAISAVQYDLYYNTSVIWAEWANPGKFLNQSGAETDVVFKEIYNEWDVANHIGRITYAETTLAPSSSGDLPYVTEPGVLTHICFSAIGEPNTTSYLNFEDVKMSNPDKGNVSINITNCSVEIYENRDPVANASSKYWVSNVASKFQCFAKLCCCNSHGGDDTWKGKNITYVRWDFGDGQYGTSEGLEDCQKPHMYTSWNWIGGDVPGPIGGANYLPFIAHLTVRDDGCPPKSDTASVPVVVYIAGDTNGDGIVDIYDAACVGKHWMQEADNIPPLNCGHYWNETQADEADLNNDNCVDVIDAMIVGTNWDHIAWYPYELP